MTLGFTLLSTPDKKPAKKIIKQCDDGTIEKYPARICQYVMKPVEVASLEALRDGLERLAACPNFIVIPGAPAPGLDLAQPQYRRWTSEPRTIVDIERELFVIDIDKAPVPSPFGGSDMVAESGTHIRDTTLPEEFHGVRCVVSASASTGLCGPDRFSGRMWFQLAEPVWQSVLEQYSKGLAAADYPVNPSLARLGQPNCTARPWCIGMADPVPRSNWALIRGSERGGDGRPRQVCRRRGGRGGPGRAVKGRGRRRLVGVPRQHGWRTG